MHNDLIIIKEYCSKCHIDPNFILMLKEDGLIDVWEIEKEQYIPASQLLELEKYTRLYYDLSINIEGIDVIQHLLKKIEYLHKEVQKLKKQLNFYLLKEDNF